MRPPTLALVTDLDALHRVNEQAVVQALRQGALMGAQFLQGLWVRLAQGMGVRATGAYVRGIQTGGIVTISETLGEGADGVASWEIILDIRNNAPHARWVEEGHAAFALPEVIDWGNQGGRIKMSKNGTPYLHIPFRHRAFQSASQRESSGMTVASIKQMMPEEVYSQAKRLARTMPLRTGQRRDARGWNVAADRYRWGGRLDRSGTRPQINLGGPGVKNAGGPGEPGFEEHRGARFVGKDAHGNALVNPAWGASKFDGMFKSGPKGHTQYMTIRTITPHSTGWRIPAQQGRYVALATSQAAAHDGRLERVVMGAVLAAITGEAP